MNDSSRNSRKLEESLAALLSFGSWLASILIGVGLIWAIVDFQLGGLKLEAVPGMSIVKIGILLFILLPVFRVLLMLFVFVSERRYHLAVTSILVLAIIFLGFAVGMRTASAIPG